MTSKERVLCALSGGQPDRVPFAEHQIDEPVLNALFGEKPAGDPVYVADELGLDILTFTLVPPLFVEKIMLDDGRSHQTAGKLHTRADLCLLETMDSPEDPELYKELESLVVKADERAVVGKCRLGLSAMLMSMDLTGFSFALADDPDLIVTILKKYLSWAEVAVEEMAGRGVDVIWFFDDMAYHSGPVMSPQVFRELLLPHIRRVTAGLSLPWIFHSDGDLRPVLKDLLSLGMNGLHPIEPACMSLKDLKHQIGNRVCLIGNVDVDVLARGTVEQTRSEVRRCLRDGASGGGYMISSSNSIPGYAVPENVLALAECIREERLAVYDNGNGKGSSQ